MLELQIDSELKAWIDPLSPEEYSQLETSILAEGCRDPLVVWGGYLLDGHNRYEICQRHGIGFATHEKTGLFTKADVKIWMIENQLGKRNTTDFARVALVLKLKPLLEQRSKERQATSTGGSAPQLRLNSDATPVRTDEGIAKAAGVGRDTVRKVEKIIDKGSAEVIEQVRSGKMSINAAAKTVMPPNAKARLAPTQFRASREKPAVAAPDETDQPDLLKELEASDKECRRLQQLVADMSKDELAAQVAAWSLKFDQLSGRLAQVTSTSNEAAKQAKSSGELLAKVRKALGVESNAQILAAISKLQA